MLHGSPGAVFGSGLEQVKGNGSIPAVQSALLCNSELVQNQKRIIDYQAMFKKPYAPRVGGVLGGSKAITGFCLSMHAEDIV